MDERDLLKELLMDADAEHNKYLRECCDNEEEPEKGFYDYLADFLLANGVTVQPCKIGDTVWTIRDFKGIKHPQEGIVSDMYFTKDMSLHIVVKYVARGEFGKTVFLTREEAEAKLREKSE